MQFLITALLVPNFTIGRSCGAILFSRASNTFAQSNLCQAAATHAMAPAIYNLLEPQLGCPGAPLLPGAEGGGGRFMAVDELRMWGGGEEISWRYIHNFERSMDSQLSRKKTQMKKIKKVEL
jgi:hypothetical protein